MNCEKQSYMLNLVFGENYLLMKNNFGIQRRLELMVHEGEA
jgi:hypothetical protein